MTIGKQHTLCWFVFYQSVKISHMLPATKLPVWIESDQHVSVGGNFGCRIHVINGQTWPIARKRSEMHACPARVIGWLMVTRKNILYALNNQAKNRELIHMKLRNWEPSNPISDDSESWWKPARACSLVYITIMGDFVDISFISSGYVWVQRGHLLRLSDWYGTALFNLRVRTHIEWLKR